MSLAVRDMFDTISRRYDRLNHVLSAGRDIAWRRRAVALLPARAQRILDLCGGTGDFLIAASAHGRVGRGSAIGDFSSRMLGIALDKGISSVACADALRLPFRPASFDAVLCGFGMRNLDDLGEGARSVAQVLAPGGLFLTLEFFRPEQPVPRFFYGVLAPIGIPLVGRVFGSRASAYEYLVRSIRRFSSVDEYAAILERDGFEDVSITSLDFGICHLVAARRRADAAPA